MGFFSFLPFVADDPEPLSAFSPTTPAPFSTASGPVPIPMPGATPVPTPQPGDPPAPAAPTVAPPLPPTKLPPKPGLLQPALSPPPPSFTDPGLAALPDDVLQMLSLSGVQVQKPTPQPDAPDGYRLRDVRQKRSQPLAQHRYDYAERDFNELQKIAGVDGRLQRESLPQLETDVNEAVPLTRKAYENLNEDQRKAVDFNTLLVKAREKDLKRSAPVDPNDTEYNDRVSKIFGEGGGADIKAPATLKLLEAAEFKALGQDLDEYLALKSATSFDQLKDIDILPSVAPFTGEGEGDADRPWTQTRGWSNQESLKVDLLNRVGSAIAEARSSTKQFTSPLVRNLTKPAGERTPIGWGDATKREKKEDQYKETFFQKAYGWLSNPGNTDIGLFESELAKFKLSQDERDELWQYVDNFSRYEEDRPAASMENRRTPQQIRQMIGLEKADG